jgi:hypothetical protein
MSDVLKRVQRGSALKDDWEAPLARNHADIGEIKHSIEDHLYRLYVYAPRNTPDLLLLLQLAWKPPGEEGLEIQNDQIDKACTRLLNWSAQPRT